MYSNEHSNKHLGRKAQPLDESPWWIEIGHRYWSQNNTVDPHSLTKSSKGSVLVRCPKCEAEFEMSVKHLVYESDPCPLCSGRQVKMLIRGVNDLASQRPDLLVDWDEDLNGVAATEVRISETKRRYWHCHICGGVYRQPTRDKVNGHACPYCSHQRTLAGFNDLATHRPDLAEQWHPSKNGTITPAMVQPGTNKKAWWLGKCGHEWEAMINSRSYSGNGCPYCAGQKVLEGFNDLATIFPDVAEEWHPTKNGKLTPDQVTSKSTRYAWWKGRNCGHEWKDKIGNRTIKGYGCPYCSAHKTIRGETDLETLYPEIAAEWHPTKNGDLLPSEVSSKSNKTIWWLGKCGHEWDAIVSTRTCMGCGCPICSGKRLAPGINDLATTHPDLVNQWDYSKNTNLSPSQVTAGSNKRAWWVCEHNHSWNAIIASRTKSGTGCPVCSGRKVLAGFNDFASRCPDIAKEWHPTKNGNLKPDEVTCGSHKIVWWQGTCGHEWMAPVKQRALHKCGCPICNEPHLENHAKIVFQDLFADHPELIIEPQWSHPECRGKKFPLRFDFAILDAEKIPLALFECQGLQHYEYVEFFGDYESWLEGLERDREKRRFCHDNGIPLMELCYEEDDSQRRHNVIGFLTTIGVLPLSAYISLTSESCEKVA